MSEETSLERPTLVAVDRSAHTEFLAGCARRVRPSAEPVILPLTDPLVGSTPFRKLPVATGPPARAVVDAAFRANVGMIAMACEAHRQRWSWFRPLVEDVLRAAPAPVLVCKPTPAQLQRLEESVQRILVPLDGSLPADGVLPNVTQLAKAHQAEVVLLNVEETGPRPHGTWTEGLFEELSEGLGGQVSPEALAELSYPARALERLGERHERLLAEGLRVRSEVALGDVVDEINAFAEHADLIVLAKSGLRVDGDQHWFGSVTKHVLRTTLVPLIVCPAGASARLPRVSPLRDGGF